MVSDARCTEDSFLNSFSSFFSCDVVSDQGVISLVFNLLTKYDLPSSWQFLYGGGLGYYRIDQTLSLTAQGREDTEFDTVSETSISPQIRLGLVYHNIEIIYSYSLSVGGPKTGSGNNQQLGLFYLFGSE